MSIADLKDPLEQRLDAEEQEQEKQEAAKTTKTYCVWANIPWYCHVEAESEEEAKKIAVEEGEWDACDHQYEPTMDDIYDVSLEEDEPKEDQGA